jgi:hypothetical protein
MPSTESVVCSLHPEDPAPAVIALSPYPVYQVQPGYLFAGLPPYYQQEFNQIAASNETYKGKWNWAAFCFGPLWALTKGAWATFLVSFIANILIIAGTCGWGLAIVWILPIIYGLRGNYIYYCVVAKQKQIIF